MANKKIVVALGRNAFSESFPKQQERVKLAAKAIADLVEEKYDVVITHSNGPAAAHEYRGIPWPASRQSLPPAGGPAGPPAGQ